MGWPLSFLKGNSIDCVYGFSFWALLFYGRGDMIFVER